MSKSEKYYSIEMQKEGDELLIAYWMFDDLQAAKKQLELLAKGCTAYNVKIELRDEKIQLLGQYQMGDEENPAVKLV